MVKRGLIKTNVIERLSVEHHTLSSDDHSIVPRVKSMINFSILDSTRQKQTLEKHFTPSKLERICAECLKRDSVDKNRPERYWVTLIALYSGSRLNEICQMNLSDIEEQDGIWVMNRINDPEDKNIKTQSGNRVVPLHPKLIDPGLLNYVTEIRNKNETKLFPNLKRSELSSYGSPIGQWFGRYLKNPGLKKRG